MQVAGRHYAPIQQQGHGRNGVERGQRVKGQIDADRIKYKIRVKRILTQVEQRVFDPPQIPGNGRVVAAVAGKVSGKVQGGRPGEE